MKHAKLVALLLSASFSTTMLAACTERDGSPARGVMNGGMPSKADIGTAAGVVGGGVLGSTIGGGAGQVVATIGGALLGGLLGNSIGGSLDNADRQSYDKASQRSMESGSSQSWKNSSTGNHGSIRPQKTYMNDEGRTCREYTQTIYVDGKPHNGHGTACRDTDGTWRIIE